MITEYFSILLRKSFLQTNLKKKSFLQQISSNQISFFRRNPFDNHTKQPKLKKPPFYSYPHSNNLISFKMTFIGLIFV
ncbi:hypothetical protein F7228_04850 [Helicobacter pylori]|nr:hypothetical protein [Helicobacter pylori]